ncbi:MAG: hypothetical protein IPG64_25485 [Haliea sp.]|nr:hypothetical protein [Haliea sp.]MBK6740957.1 hypothetical protein [Haliea sp.]
MTNIETFNIAVAVVFGKCYTAFPLRVNIDIADLGKTIQETLDPDCENDIDMREPEYAIARESTRWLIDAGYLWCTSQRNMSFAAVTLTPKALEILNAVPEQLHTRTSFGEELGKGVKEIGRDAAKDFVKAVLAYGVSLAVGT